LGNLKLKLVIARIVCHASKLGVDPGFVQPPQIVFDSFDNQGILAVGDAAFNRLTDAHLEIGWQIYRGPMPDL
jgi:hypothetical protein